MLFNILLIINLVFTIILIGFGVFIYMNLSSIFNESSNIKKIETNNTEEIKNIKKEIENLKKNPAEFTKRLSMVDFKIKQLENTIETFNYGFNPNQSYM